MQVDSPDQIRNITLAGHADTGKTTLASAVLHTSGMVNRLGKVDDGNATTDFDEQEIERGHSIGLAPCYAGWQKHKVNVIDTPGSAIFSVEARAGLRAGDAMVLVVNAAAGVEVMTERMWRYAADLDLPALVHVNKMDRENVELEQLLESLQASFGASMVQLQLPIGEGEGFRGVVDLIAQKAFVYERDGDGTAKEEDVPADMEQAMEMARNELIEAVAETSEELMEEYFDEGTLPDDDLVAGLAAAIAQREIFAVTYGSALHGIGTSAFLDTVVRALPDPTVRGTFPATDVGGEEIEVATSPDEPFSALVFKTINDPFTGKINIFRVVSGEAKSDSAAWNTRAEQQEKLGQLLHLQGKTHDPAAKLVTGDVGGVAKLKDTLSGDTLCDKSRPVKLGWIDVRPPVISYAVEPKSKGDEEKISDALHRMMEEDLGLAAGRDPQTHEFLLSGSGELHVDIAIARLKSRFNVDVIKHPPTIPYRETIRRAAEGHGRHKKQTGGRGQFADCHIRIEPLPSGEEFEFVDEIFGGAIPQTFRPAVEKGIEEARRKGYLAGFPVVDFRVRLQDGQYHDVDSSEMAFKVAGSMAWKDAMQDARPTLLEPVMSVEITTSEEYMGDVMGDLSQHRGRPQGMETLGNRQVIKATVPMAEMLDYAPRLRSLTQGRARFTMEFQGYEEVPKQLQKRIIEAAEKGEDED